MSSNFLSWIVDKLFQPEGSSYVDISPPEALIREHGSQKSIPIWRFWQCPYQQLKDYWPCLHHLCTWQLKYCLVQEGFSKFHRLVKSRHQKRKKFEVELFHPEGFLAKTKWGSWESRDGSSSSMFVVSYVGFFNLSFNMSDVQVQTYVMPSATFSSLSIIQHYMFPFQHFLSNLDPHQN